MIIKVKESKKHDVFVRLGVMMQFTEAELLKMAEGDNMPMQQALAKGDYRVSGETYIPQAALEDAGIPFDDDIDMDL